MLQMVEVFSSVWIAGYFDDVALTADIIERQVKWKDNHGTEGRKKYEMGFSDPINTEVAFFSFMVGN
jgi:hypothetical protein